MTTGELPAPLTPPDCDLRGYDFMPLFGHRLFRSELYEQTDGEEFKAAVKLWWEAWNQCPAGSLPNDDAKLCRLADMGRDMKSWRRMREAVLRGFVLCTDGRLYHRLLCEWAMDAYERRVRDRERKRQWRANRTGGGTDGGSPIARPRDNVWDNDASRRGHGASSQSTSASRPRRVPDERRGEERRGQDRTGELSKIKILTKGSEPTVSEPLATDSVGSAATENIVAITQNALRIRAYPPGKMPQHDADEQRAAVAPERPRTAYLTAEQLAKARRRA